MSLNVSKIELGGNGTGMSQDQLNDFLKESKIEPTVTEYNPFFVDDEEDLHVRKVELSEEKKFQKKLQDAFRESRSAGRTGASATRFLTTDLLKSAPVDFFDRFDSIVAKTVSEVQTQLSSSDRSSLVSEANSDPTNETLETRAFREVRALTAKQLENSPHDALDRAIITNLVCNEIVGFGRLDPLWRDKSVDEIICNGPYDVQVEIAGKLSRVPACRFASQDHLTQLINKLYAPLGKGLSPTTPLVKGRMHDNSRLFAVSTNVAPSGPNLNIRRHKDSYRGPEFLISKGSADEKILTWLGNMIYQGASWLIIGGTSTGKTTLLSALSAFFREDGRVLSIEDNIELKLHPAKLYASPMECVNNRIEGNGEGGITMRDLVKSALQMRPDGIVIGEVTDGAAYDLCQALNTGHWGCSTLHANSEKDAMNRIMSLVSQDGTVTGESVLSLVSSAFDFIIHAEHFAEDGSRKITSVSEVGLPVRNEHGELIVPTNRIWTFRTEGIVDHRVTGRWEKVGELSDERRRRLRLDLAKEMTWEDLNEIAKIGEDE